MIEVDLTTEVLFQNPRQGIYKLWQTLQNSLYNLKLICSILDFLFLKIENGKSISVFYQ